MRRPIVALSLALACSGDDPITWTEPRQLAVSIAPGTMLAFAGDSAPALVARPAADSATGDRVVCQGSVVVADDGAGGAFAAWWEVRPDHSVTLLVARRARDGDRRWGLPVVADDRDRGRRACDRPPAAIAADGRRGHVHLAYFLEPADGAGVFAGHSMEDGAYFHGPVAIVYGDRPARAAVAVEGDLVVYAHEDPNSVRSRVAMAVSTTAGHLIEHRLPASPPSVVASAPMIAVGGGRVAVAWLVTRPDSASAAIAQVRIGALGLTGRPGAGGAE